MQYFLFAFLITKLFQVNDNILYIPKKFNIYVEIPNGPQKFLDDFPVLKIFKITNISIKNQEPLDTYDENMINLFLLVTNTLIIYIECGFFQLNAERLRKWC